MRQKRAPRFGHTNATDPGVQDQVEVAGTGSAVLSLPRPRGHRGVADIPPRGREVPYSQPDSSLWCMTDFRDAPRGCGSGPLFPEIWAPGRSFLPAGGLAAGQPRAVQWAESQGLGLDPVPEPLSCGLPGPRGRLWDAYWPGLPKFLSPDGGFPGLGEHSAHLRDVM